MSTSAYRRRESGAEVDWCVVREVALSHVSLPEPVWHRRDRPGAQKKEWWRHYDRSRRAGRPHWRCRTFHWCCPCGAHFEDSPRYYSCTAAEAFEGYLRRIEHLAHDNDPDGYRHGRVIDAVQHRTTTRKKAPTSRGPGAASAGRSATPTSSSHPNRKADMDDNAAISATFEHTTFIDSRTGMPSQVFTCLRCGAAVVENYEQQTHNRVRHQEWHATKG